MNAFAEGFTYIGASIGIAIVVWAVMGFPAFWDQKK
jgi:hypothetical protein